MPVTRLPAPDFLHAARHTPVLDVRSPGEYAHAHIPGAHALPLFTDAERAAIGTAYKQESRETAIKIGLDAFGPRMRRMVETVEDICRQLPGKRVLVHCWRGGMRSGAAAWLLDLYGFEVSVLEGGYKAYRQWVIAHWHQPRPCRVIAGYTGSAKTAVLHELEKKGAPVLDLEALAGHKGSAFGGLGQTAQPAQEMFENRIAARLDELQRQYPHIPVWVEDESERIGNLNIPHALLLHLRSQPAVFLELPFEERLRHITAEYGRHSTEGLLNAIIRIKKRLGGLETKTAVNHLLEGDVRECFRVLLHYYDRQYRKADEKRAQPGAGRMQTVPFETIDASAMADALLNTPSL